MKIREHSFYGRVVGYAFLVRLTFYATEYFSNEIIEFNNQIHGAVMNKKLFFAVLLILLSILLLAMHDKKKPEGMQTFNVNAVTEDEIKDELIIALFVESITENVNHFYSEFYSGQIAVYNYEIDVLEVVKNNGHISIKFGVTPQIGAHNPLGYDELTYLIDSAGNGKLTKYEHIKNYPIPERFEK